MTGISTLAQALSQIDRIKVQQFQLNDLSTQLATGKKTQRFSGLGTDVLTSKRARASFQSLEVYESNIKNADRRVKLMLTSVAEFQEQSKNLLNAIDKLAQQSTHQDGDIVYWDDPTTPLVEENIQVGLTSVDPSGDLETMISSAKNIFDFFGALINTKDGDRYLFHGAETGTIPYTDTGTLDAAAGSLMTDWKNETITTTELIANIQARDATANSRAITDSTIGYSIELSTGNTGTVFSRIDDAVEVNYTALGNADPFRDVMVAVAVIKNAEFPPIADTFIPPNSPAGAAPPLAPDVQGAPGFTLQEQTDNFFAVLNALATSISDAIDDLDQISFDLGAAQGRMENMKIAHAEEKSLLSGVISDVEDADQSTVAVKLNTVLTQLEASYSVTARVQRLSLTNFI